MLARISPLRHARARAGGAVALTMLLLAATAAAQAPTEGSASLDIWMIQHSSHSPCGGVTARFPTSEGPTFQANGGVTAGDCLDGTWSLGCSEAGLVFACDLAGVPEWYEWGRWTQVLVEVACVLPVAEPTTLSATRAFDSGPVTLEGTHDVVLTAPDGTESRLFEADPAAVEAVRTLGPGEWRIAIDVAITLADRNLMQYSGAVTVDWQAAVGDGELSWGAIKALYR